MKMVREIIGHLRALLILMSNSFLWLACCAGLLGALAIAGARFFLMNGKATSQAYIAEVKNRAWAHIEDQDFEKTFAGVVSDLSRHPHAIGRGVLNRGVRVLTRGFLSSRDRMLELIESFQAETAKK